MNLRELIINEDEAKVVRKIFEYAVNHGYGNNKIAKKLKEQHIPTRKGDLWKESSITYMRKNLIYKGYPAYGESSQSINLIKTDNSRVKLIDESK